MSVLCLQERSESGCCEGEAPELLAEVVKSKAEGLKWFVKCHPENHPKTPSCADRALCIM